MRAGLFTALALAAAAAGCGGGGAFGNSPDVINPPAVSGQKLSFEYFQRCVNPVLIALLQVPGGGTQSCASSGCHDDANGTGGAFRMVAGATLVTPVSDPAAVRTSDMYKNFFSAMGSSVIGAPTSSRMVNKPLVRGVLHGGGVIFASDTDPNLKRIEYWISRPMPAGQDEFSSASAAMFTPTDPATGSCNTQ